MYKLIGAVPLETSTLLNVENSLPLSPIGGTIEFGADEFVIRDLRDKDSSPFTDNDRRGAERWDLLLQRYFFHFPNLVQCFLSVSMFIYL